VLVLVIAGDETKRGLMRRIQEQYRDCLPELQQ
jgi:hypothetical protein